MSKCNEDLRKYLKQKEVRHWEIASLFGYSRTHFSKCLQKELPEDIKDKIKKCVDNYVNGVVSDTSFFKEYCKRTFEKERIRSERQRTLEKQRRFNEQMHTDDYTNKILRDVASYEERNNDFYS